ncbi:MAG: DUF4340 domain-containing protein [Phycisphaerales bacterium]|nr:MAG: DUF4340 domain-containing protein [Phycisphaerales bacterium]
MKNKTTLILIVLALAVTAVAWMVVVGGSKSSAPQAEPSPLLPALATGADEVAKIELKSGDTAITISKAADATWAVESKGGYPAKPDAVRDLVRGLARATTIDERTSDPALYARLGVQDPGPSETASTPADETEKPTLVALHDAGGKPLATLIVGKMVQGAATTATQGESRFVRKAGEAKSWAAQGLPPISLQAATWLDTELLKIEQARVDHVTIEHLTGPQATLPEGSTVEIARRPKAPEAQGPSPTPATPPSTGDFEVVGLPAGRELNSTFIPTSIAGSLAALRFDDVKPRESIVTSDASPRTVTTFKTNDGLTITARVFDTNGASWIAFDASTTPTGSVSETTATEVQSQNTRLAPWAFAIPAYSLRLITSGYDTLLKPTAAPSDTTPESDTPVGPVN